MKKIIIMCAALLLGVACSEKISSNGTEDQTAKGFPYTFTAVVDFNTGDQSRVCFTDFDPADPKTAVWKAVWQVGDQVRVQNQPGKDKTVIYVVKSVTDGVATFEVKEGEDLNKFNESTTFFATIGGLAADTTYPYLFEFNSANRGGIHAGLSTYKSILENSINNSFFTAVSKATLADGKISFHFLPIISYLRFRIPEGMSYDVGQFYFSSSGKYCSGLYNARMSDTDNTIYELGSRYTNGGGSANLPVWYGTGSSNVTAKPYPTFKPGVYYVPVIPSATVYKVIVKDTQGTAKLTKEFTAISMKPGGIYDLGTIPTE